MNTQQLFALNEKTAVVTGGESRLGRYITEGLLESGATVILASPDRENAKKLVDSHKQKSSSIEYLYFSLDDHESIVKAKEDIKTQFGAIDILINNAIAHPMKSFDDPLKLWEESMKINATGLFDFIREFSTLFGNSGVILNIASMQGTYAPDFSLYTNTDKDSPPDYHFHKGGLIALTKYLAGKLAVRKIRVNSLSPGAFFNHQSEPFYSRYINKVPLQRMAVGDDIKGAAVFLVSDASAYITGQDLLMDGGLHG
mgnify:CR=1 FL=1